LSCRVEVDGREWEKAVSNVTSVLSTASAKTQTTKAKQGLTDGPGKLLKVNV